MLAQRVAAAAVAIPLIVLVVWFGGDLMTAVVAAAVLIAVLEIEGAIGDIRRPVAMLAGALAAALPPAAQLGLDWMTWFVTGIAILPALTLVFAPDPREAVVSWLWAVAPALFFGWLAAHFVLLRHVPDGREWVYLVLLTVWITDSGAYFVGRAIGHRKLAPAISPGKTWEGAVGGEFCGYATVVVLNRLFDLGLAPLHVVALGLLTPLAGQLGDLAESALKRGLGVKDSSHLIPGHGGVADRLDSLLFAAPVVYYYLQWIIR